MRALFLQSACKVLIDRKDSWGKPQTLTPVFPVNLDSEKCNMGVIKTISCTQCNYESDQMRIGSGMLGSGPEEILVCTHCELLFAGTAGARRERSSLLAPGNSHCQCPRCDTECSPVQTYSPPQTRRLLGLVRTTAAESRIQCPRCGSLNTQSNIIGLWD